MHILLQHVRACTCACHAVLMCGLCVQVAEQLPRVQLTGCEAIFVHAEWDINPTTEQAALHTLPSLLAPLLPSTATLSLSWPTASRRLKLNPERASSGRLGHTGAEPKWPQSPCRSQSNQPTAAAHRAAAQAYKQAGQTAAPVRTAGVEWGAQGRQV